MTSQPIRDQVKDHLLTPKNAALIIIDYQPTQVSSIASMDHLTLVANIVAVAKLAKLYIVHRQDKEIRMIAVDRRRTWPDQLSARPLIH